MIAASSDPVGLLGAVERDRDTDRTDAVGVQTAIDIVIEDSHLPSTSTPRNAVTSTQPHRLRAGVPVPTDITEYALGRPANMAGHGPADGTKELDAPDNP